MLLAAACGDNSTVDGPASTQPAGETGDPSAATASRWLPEVCGVASWTTTIAGDPAMDVSVVSSPAGATMFAVPQVGGSLTAFSIDNRMNALNTGTKVPIAEAFTSVSGSLVDGRLTTAATDGTVTRVHLLDAQLNATEIAKLDGNLVARPAFFQTDGARILPYGNSAGMHLQVFDNNWNPTSVEDVVATAQPTGLAATQFGQATLVAMSTDTSCYLQMIATTIGGYGSHMSYPCTRPRIAADVSRGMAGLVFEGANAVRFVNISHTQMGGASIVLRSGAQEPRITFDGKTYWISYLDARGEVSVGFLDENNHLISTGLPGVQPLKQAHEIVMIGGSPWVIALDKNGYTAHKICAVQAN